ncbi:MAG: hypothetical protein LBD93_03460 [Treponema sp.]|nr:hypothetical protein [Treponema sp.]
MAVNEPRTLKAMVPAGLTPGMDYYLRVSTMNSPKGSGYVLKTSGK